MDIAGKFLSSVGIIVASLALALIFFSVHAVLLQTAIRLLRLPQVQLSNAVKVSVFSWFATGIIGRVSAWLLPGTPPNNASWLLIALPLSAFASAAIYKSFLEPKDDQTFTSAQAWKIVLTQFVLGIAIFVTAAALWGFIYSLFAAQGRISR